MAEQQETPESAEEESIQEEKGNEKGGVGRVQTRKGERNKEEWKVH